MRQLLDVEWIPPTTKWNTYPSKTRGDEVLEGKYWTLAESIHVRHLCCMKPLRGVSVWIVEPLMGIGLVR